jgi:DNA-binding response OmpR family regulator
VRLVDDDQLVLAHLSNLVRAAGLEVHTMDDGSTTLALLEQHFTPIVITDLNMPAMDGLALCRAIRQQVSPGYVYILLLAVHDAEPDILAGLEAGADDCLSKRTSSAQRVARLHTAQRRVVFHQATDWARNSASSAAQWPRSRDARHRAREWCAWKSLPTGASSA